MKAYKLNSNELYRVQEEDGKIVLEVEYALAYRKGEVKKEKVYLFAGNRECTVVTQRGEESRFKDPSAAEKLDDKVLAAIELLPLHVKQPIRKALERKE